MNKTYCRMMSRYNTGANALLYDACRMLSPGDLAKDRKAFFKSILGTLNHLWTGDEIWMTRFEGGEIPSTHLDAILFDDVDDLWAARKRQDARIDAFFADVADDFFQGSIDYVNNAGKHYTEDVATATVHFFNHQTHHRGQVHAMLTQTEVDAPSLDLHRIINP